jgi:hypothetical protein
MREWALTPSEAVEADLRDHGQRRVERHPPDMLISAGMPNTELLHSEEGTT